MALFAPDPDVRVIGSEVGEGGLGPDAIRAFFTHLFSRQGAFRWEWDERRVSARGDVAWLVAEGWVRTTGSGTQDRRPCRFTAVLERRDGAWLMLLLHGAEPVAPSAALLPPA